MNMRILRRGEEVDRDACCASWSTSSTPATTRCSRAARSGCGGTCSRSSRPYAETAYRIDVVRRRGRAPAALRPADRRGARGRLEHVAIYPATHYDVREGDDRAGGRGHRRELERALQQLEGEGKLLESAPPAPAHPVRHGDDAGGRVLHGDRELLADPRRPRPRGPPVLPARLLPRRTSCASSTSPTRPCRRSGRCTRATARASRRSSTSASACPRALDNRPLRFDEFLQVPRSCCSSRRPRGSSSAPERPRGRADHPPHGDRRPGGRGARDAQPDRRPAERDPRAGGRPASGCS